MRNLLLLISFVTVCQWAFAYRQTRHDEIISGLQKAGVKTDVACDTVIEFKDFAIKIKTDGDSIYHVGLDLFNPEWAEMVDPQTLEFIESALLYEIIMENHAGAAEIELTRGELSDFKNIGPNSACNITNSDTKELIVIWTTEKGKEIMVSLPILYETIRGGSRGEIEAAFINKIKNPHVRARLQPDIDPKCLEPHGEEDYILPGAQYIDRRITRNIYLSSTNASDIIWDAAKPTESISNLFSTAAIKGDMKLDLTILKHEYGEKEQLKTSVDNLLAVAEEEGCTPFWGIESFDGTTLIGSLFLYNPQQGYDHVVKIECNPAEIIDGEGIITARAYLYIPTNNVRTLDEPYRTKTEDEKIKYMDN